MKNTPEQESLANAIRFLSIDAIEKAQSGHPGLPMGAADIASVLFTRFLSYDPKKPDWPNRDRFILSAGHGSMLLYALLYLTGYADITLDDIKNFRQFGAKTAGHPEYGYAAGIETTTGPLGQGLAMAVGMAMGERLMQARFGDLIDHYTYVLVGDGCLMEGLSQEAISFAGHMKFNKLIVFWDDNNICIDGAVSLVDSTDQKARFEACGWRVFQVDGHCQEAIAAAIEQAKLSDKPSLIACKTTIGFGSPNKAGTNKVHGSPLGAEELQATREELGWGAAPFEVPAEILDNWRLAGLQAARARKTWQEKFEKLDLHQKGEFERWMRGEFPGGWQTALAAYKEELCEEEPTISTRKASQNVLEKLTQSIPELIGGSADLTSSNNTKTTHTASVTPEDFSGRYIHYGIREHGMAAMMNGLALYGGFVPYGGTFLCFSDYLRPALRLSSLMHLRVIYVFSHDSIGLGEDGPTHQPIEHLASLRAMPNHLVFRPADAVETLECWQLALQAEKTPSSLVLTRQDLPCLRFYYEEDNICSFGAYELKTARAAAKVTLFASGSEVTIAAEAHDMLEEKGIGCRVISVPCFKLFAAQSESYQKELIGTTPIKIAIEAAVKQGWESFIGEEGVFIGLDDFGLSAPAKDLYQHFGLTSARIVEEVEKRLAQEEEN